MFEGTLAIRLIIGRDFAVTRSSPESCCNIFRHRFRTNCRTEMADIEQTQKMIPFVSCETSLWLECRQVGFLVSMYLIWILESRFIRSNNQSSATVWVLDTCLIVRLLPLIIILITASLSSNTYNKAS